MKILQLGKFYPPLFGGIQNVMYEFTTGLNENNIHCDVLCSNDKNHYEITSIENYKIFRSPSYGIYFSTAITPKMISILNKIKNDYDIISIHFPDPMAALALYLTKPKCKIVLHWHSDIIKQKYLLKLFEPLQNWVIKRANLIISPSKIHIEASTQASLMQYKYKVLPYPINIASLEKCIDNNLLHQLKNKYKNKKIIFSMGRLIYYKGFKYLIEASKYLNEDYIILIGGEGKLQNEMQNLIDIHNLSSKVKLIGSIPYQKLGTYYKLCDIFCLPSIFKSEMFGIVQLEAMSFSKPIISSKIEGSGICNVNIHKHTGECIPTKDSLAIANAIISLSTDTLQYISYSKNARKRVEEVFDKKRVIQSLIEIYQQLLK